jgi:hypothetical protein
MFAKKSLPRSIIWAAVIALMAFAVTYVFFFNIQTQAKNATLKTIEGVSEVKASGANEFVKVPQDYPVSQGDSIKTDTTSVAIVFFPNNSSLFLDSETEVVLDQLPTTQQNLVRIKQKQGETWSKVIPNTGTQYEVKSETAIAAVRGTIFKMRVDKEQNSKVEVIESLVEVGLVVSSEQPKTTKIVEAGKKIIIEKSKVEELAKQGLEKVVEDRVKDEQQPVKQQCLDEMVNNFPVPENEDKKLEVASKIKDCIKKQNVADFGPSSLAQNTNNPTNSLVTAKKDDKTENKEILPVLQAPMSDLGGKDRNGLIQSDLPTSPDNNKSTPPKNDEKSGSENGSSSSSDTDKTDKNNSGMNLDLNLPFIKILNLDTLDSNTSTIGISLNTEGVVSDFELIQPVGDFVSGNSESPENQLNLVE